MKIEKRLWTIMAVVAAVALTRLLPHPDNFTPIVAVALFSGAYCDRRWLAFLIPLAAMLFSDVLLELFYPANGFHNLMLVVYGSFMLVVMMGFALAKLRLVYAPPLMALAASTLFFITTNFMVWLSSGFYPLTLAGLVACYIAALPFFGNALVGDLLWTSLIFGLWHLACARFPVLSDARAT